MLSRLFLAIVCALIVVPFYTSAQLSLTYERTISLIVEPEFPAPGETVRMRIESYSIDLNRSDIVWRANGVAFASGGGRTEASIRAGKLGEQTLIDVIAMDTDRNIAKATAKIAPSDIDILWDADSYVPPFYKGRALAGTNATIHAFASVRFLDVAGNTVPESSIIYTWSRNGNVLASVSGRGKSRATITGPALFGTDTISVEAETVDRSHIARANERIPASDTILNLYENHPLFGVLYHRAIVGDVNTPESEQKVTAVPFFAHIDSPGDESLIYEWRVNNQTIEARADEPQTLTIATNDYSGPASVELTLMSAADYLMRATGTWQLVFGESGGAFFGVGPNNPFGE